MVSNDDRGQQVIEACQVGGIYIPEGTAVVGVDDDGILCGLTNPPLSSVALNMDRAGYGAAELLDKLMQGEVRSIANSSARSDFLDRAPFVMTLGTS